MERSATYRKTLEPEKHAGICVLGPLGWVPPQYSLSAKQAANAMNAMYRVVSGEFPTT